ncbi:MAG TPA: polysaccharide deacetylase family protein [Alphaproteobacteria bacterium]
MPKAYLTIDDSPSKQTDRLVDGLVERGVPAILFCRGDFLEADQDIMVRAVKKGMVLGNHAYMHKRAGDLAFEAETYSITRTDILIDRVYRRANVKRPGQYFRFPYIDRGDGDLLERRFFDIIATIEDGKKVKLPETKPVARLQKWLKENGFTQPFQGVTHPLYQLPLIRDAQDCLFTYSTGDWMLNARYKGTQPLQSLPDVTAAMDADPYLMSESGAQIVLIHDHDEITDVALGIVDHMLKNKFEFLGV